MPGKQLNEKEMICSRYTSELVLWIEKKNISLKFQLPEVLPPLIQLLAGSSHFIEIIQTRVETYPNAYNIILNVDYIGG